eukprot:jgi/Mesvir1/1414/Mv14413-RA.1
MPQHNNNDIERARETCTAFLSYALGAVGGQPSRLPPHRDQLKLLFDRFRQLYPAAPSGRTWIGLGSCLFFLSRDAKAVRVQSRQLEWVDQKVLSFLKLTPPPPAGPPPAHRAGGGAPNNPASTAGGVNGPGGPGALGGGRARLMTARGSRRLSKRQQLIKDKGGVEVRPPRFFPPIEPPPTADGGHPGEGHNSGGGVLSGDNNSLTTAGTAGGAGRDAGDAVAASTGARNANVGDTLSQPVVIANRGTATRALECVRLRRPIRGSSISFTHCEGISRSSPLRLHPGTEYLLTVNCHLASPGALREMILFEFHGFTIGRHVAIDADDEVTRILRPSAPYKPKRRNRRDFLVGGPTHKEPRNFLVGGRPDMGRTVDEEAKGPRPPLAAVPDHTKALVRSGDAESLLAATPLDGDTYIRRMALLMHIEEMQMEVDIEQYDLENVSMWQEGNFLVLPVPGLAEKRPSVLRGDPILAREASGGDVLYKGFVHRVRLDDVLLQFHASLHDKWFKNKRYNIRFTFNRTSLKRMHQAIQLTQHLPPSLLFEPLGGHAPLSQQQLQQQGQQGGISAAQGVAPALDSLFNRRLNEEQQEAVRKIVALDASAESSHHETPVAFILFGPPGTGKTTTVVEAVLHVLRRAKRHSPANAACNKILVCAPSNSACDLLLLKLKSGGVTHLEALRLNAVQRAFDDVPRDLLPFCERFYNREAHAWEAPGQGEIAKVRVIVATCSSAALLHLVGASAAGLFSHVFLDEAGHALEPEALIPITVALRRTDPSGFYSATNPPTEGPLIPSSASKRAGMLVLAGDPCQLGPVIRSNLAKEQGLAKSLLERLMPDIRSAVWATEGTPAALSGPHMTMLVQNYRSHPAILDFPSRRFYDGRLLACAEKALREALCGWEGLPARGFPVVFHGVHGKCDREGSSPSWFNATEVSVLHNYVVSLLGAHRGGIRLVASDIGIVTPYRKQVEKIRKWFENLPHGRDIKVGSTEEFQGQERKVIIISTVRSNPDEIENDVKFDLGFVANEKRFNVAITRAQALLIVIGNPHVLVRDDCWSAFLRYVLEHGGYTGDVDFGADDLARNDSDDSDDEDGNDGSVDGGEGGDAIAGALGALDLTERVGGLVPNYEDPGWRTIE